MIWKLLLTSLVIIGAIYALRLRQRRTAVVAAREPVGPVITPMVRWAAIGVIGLMLIGAGAYLYHQWSDSYQVVEVQVVDSRSGKSVSYRAYKGDIAERHFTTTEGRQVNLAEVERMEVSAGGR